MLKKGYYSPRRRAAMLRGEDIVHVVVFERDEWMCHLCGEAIDPRLRGDNWMRATIDHIIDLCAGGTHTYDNVRAAHWLCNMRKAGNLPRSITAG